MLAAHESDEDDTAPGDEIEAIEVGRRRRGRVMAGTSRLAAWLVAALALAGCASTGHLSTKPDFGEPRVLRVCVLRDPAVSEAGVSALLDAWRAELAPLGITITLPWVRPWPRPAFTGRGIAEAVATIPLEPGCDRLLAMIGRHAGDAAYAVLTAIIPVGEYLGWVDNITQTRGFVVAAWSPSLCQVMAGGPADTLIHEGYHLLGCRHEALVDCHATIARLKREAPGEFFPSQGDGGWIAATREAANAALAQARWP
jgi:hypothetical protein